MVVLSLHNDRIFPFVIRLGFFFLRHCSSFYTTYTHNHKHTQLHARKHARTFVECQSLIPISCNLRLLFSHKIDDGLQLFLPFEYSTPIAPSCARTRIYKYIRRAVALTLPAYVWPAIDLTGLTTVLLRIHNRI